MTVVNSNGPIRAFFTLFMTKNNDGLVLLGGTNQLNRGKEAGGFTDGCQMNDEWHYFFDNNSWVNSVANIPHVMDVIDEYNITYKNHLFEVCSDDDIEEYKYDFILKMGFMGMLQTIAI
eukprot:CAMPEP_0117432462 /NCGR_PEP_ID=MMETSP0758-20121206/11943_1 /TAXON_ID=63605 /ORGANISM="Percolomonas cosmopolitus, Strain AE-1 (ATCC 50343)" /LENGTH=118 /DNA_ID=CAMNT_0005222389 /DNA_START=310 /DNA_END=663 /DNA_ORIENTATION=+